MINYFNQIKFIFTINYFSTNLYISFHILVYIKIHEAEENNNESNF
jgi:hypothetical protein